MKHLFFKFLFLIIALGITSCIKTEEENNFHNDFMKAAQKRIEYSKVSETNHVNFNDYFDKNSKHGIKLRTVSIAELNIKSGHIVACDPFYAGEEFTLPFDKQVKPGKYKIRLCFGNFKNWGERVAFAQLKFSDFKPVKWELAKTISKNKEPETFYGVDAGLGCFADLETANLFNKIMNKFYKEHPKGNYYDDILAHEFKNHEDWINHYPEQNNNLNIVMFSSGFGDGIYSSYWGLDAKGKIVCLVTDFQLFSKNGSIFHE